MEFNGLGRHMQPGSDFLSWFGGSLYRALASSAFALPSCVLLIEALSRPLAEH